MGRKGPDTARAAGGTCLGGAYKKSPEWAPPPRHGQVPLQGSACRTGYPADWGKEGLEGRPRAPTNLRLKVWGRAAFPGHGILWLGKPIPELTTPAVEQPLADFCTLNYGVGDTSLGWQPTTGNGQH